MDTDPPPPPPLKVWVMSMNRHVTTDEIVRGLNKIEDEETRKLCLNKPTRDECIRAMISKLYPTIVMQHKLARFRFRRNKTSTGKEFYQSNDPNVYLGYSVADTGSLVAMAWATGPLPQVVNIGLDVMKFSIPRNTTVNDFFESVKHKLTEREQRDVSGGGANADEVLLRRLLIILTIKSAYIKAIQQPSGFDYRRMECQLPTQTFKVDGHELIGWEIRLFKANLGIQRKELLVEEVYQCCAVIYRGVPGAAGLNNPATAAAMQAAFPPGKRNKIYWNDREGEATEMLNFLKVDQIVKAYDGLVLKNGAGSNNVNGRARVPGSSSGSGAVAGGPSSAVSPTSARRLGEQPTRRSSEDTARMHAQAGVMH